jgi:hypothetical protein
MWAYGVNTVHVDIISCGRRIGDQLFGLLVGVAGAVSGRCGGVSVGIDPLETRRWFQSFGCGCLALDDVCGKCPSHKNCQRLPHLLRGGIDLELEGFGDEDLQLGCGFSGCGFSRRARWRPSR